MGHKVKVGVGATGASKDTSLRAPTSEEGERAEAADVVGGFLTDLVPVGRAQVPTLATYVCMYVVYVVHVVSLHNDWVWSSYHLDTPLHVKLPQVNTNKQNNTHTSSHQRIYPLAGPLVTAPESLFLKSYPSSALVLTPSSWASLASDIST